MRDPVRTVSLLVALGLFVIGMAMALQPSSPAGPRTEIAASNASPGTSDSGPGASHRPGPAGGSRDLQYSAVQSEYMWLDALDQANLLANRIPPPPGYERLPGEPKSFADWLRRIPLRKGRPQVLLFDGQAKPNQDAHFAVVDIDTGRKDLQQCADAIMRLRAEHLFAGGKQNDIHFNFTGGLRADWTRWAQGDRPIGSGSTMRWRTGTGRQDFSYRNFRTYLETVFKYAGTLSLSRELVPVTDVAGMQIGDVFIQGGSPGHAVIVIDVAVNRATGGKAFLLAQSYMPAQDFHVLKNPNDLGLNPWYKADYGDVLVTPEWRFRRADLKRFP